MASTSNHYILILCGGSGPRLWPKSRSNFPKQFLNLFGQKSLLHQTIDRCLSISSLSHLFIVTQKKYLNEILEQYRNFPKQNIILEPERRNTGTAIAYASFLIKQRHPNAIITSAPSDHYITNLPIFKAQISHAAKIAHQTSKIVTLGVRPTFPHPGFGYIAPSTRQIDYYEVNRFVEKPIPSQAKILIHKKALWNSGIYTFSVSTFFNELEICHPQLFSLIKKLEDKKTSIRSFYLQAPNISFDKAISETSKNLVCLPVKFNWNDVGEWPSVWNILTKDKQGIASINSHTKYISVDSKNCLIDTTTEKIIGLVGVNNLSIIDTKDALLVCNFQNSYNVKDLVSQIVKSPQLKKYFLTKNDR